MERECDQNIVNRKWFVTGYPDKAVVSIVTPSCVASQPIRDEALTGQEVMLTTLAEHAITSLITHIQCTTQQAWRNGSLNGQKNIRVNRSARPD